MPDKEETAYDKNTRAQYEALGHFVEKFEMMVNEAREISIECLCRNTGSSERERLIEIPFHHHALSAMPLFDIMRAIVAEIVNTPTSPHYADRAKFKSLLGHIEGEYNRLAGKRNELLHGTWFIGYRSGPDPHSSEFFLRKYKTTADGLVSAKELPKNAVELLDLATRCEDVRVWLAWMECSLSDGTKITDLFEQTEKTWGMIWPRGDRTTLPRK